MSAIEYPHPVLYPEGNDYRIDCEFDLEFLESDQRIEGEEIFLRAGYRLECDGLEDLINDGSAKTYLLLHCPAASCRRMYPFGKGAPQLEISIGKYDVIDKIELQCVLVAADDLAQLSLDEFNPVFFEGALFRIAKGSVLAISKKVAIYLDDADLEKPVSSIFNINRCPAQEKPITSDFSSDTGKIEINLNEGLFSLYSQIERGYANTLRRLLTGIIVQPVLTEALCCLQNAREEYQDYRWARVIEKKLELNGISLEDNIEPAITLADMLLGNIEEDSLKTLVTIIEDQALSDPEGYSGGVD